MQRLLARAILGLLFYDLLVCGFGFGMLRRTMLRRPTAARKPPDQAIDRALAAVNLACRLYPHKAMCLQRSAVLASLLRSVGVRAQVVIGVRKIPFRAHAWVEVDGRSVNEGARVREFFQVLEVC